MSALEFRIDSAAFPIAKIEGKADAVQAFSIGHETCAVQFLQVTQSGTLLDFLGRQKRAGKAVRIVTPFLPERYLAPVQERLRALFQQECFADSVVIVNDLGLMIYLHKIDPARCICLGRTLLFSFDYTPWGEAIFASESEAVQAVMRQVNLWDDEKLAFFRACHGTEIEANLTAGTLESLQKIQRAGWKVNVHKDTFLYGTQRSCFVKRFSRDPACCTTECHRLERLELSQLWEPVDFYAKPEGMPFPEPLFLRGNQILGAGRAVPRADFDGIILDGIHLCEMGNRYENAIKSTS